jgi:hypothetical protein
MATLGGTFFAINFAVQNAFLPPVWVVERMQVTPGRKRHAETATRSQQGTKGQQDARSKKRTEAK